MLSEISQTREILYDFTHMQNLKKTKNEQTNQYKNKFADTENKLKVARV